MRSNSSGPAGSSGQSIVKTGAEIIVDSLIREGVDTMFGYLRYDLSYLVMSRVVVIWQMLMRGRVVR